MDENKKQRIIGLVVGFIGLILLFFLSYEFFVFEGMFYSVIGQISIEIAQMTTRCYNCDDEAIWFWVGFGIIYFFLIWKYRACVGHWVFKIFKVFYKKL